MKVGKLGAVTASWHRPAISSAGEPPPSALVAGPRVESACDWVLFVGESEGALELAASHWIVREMPGLPVISPPEAPPLPIAVHVLPPPGLDRERVLYVPRLDEAFFGPSSFSATSPLYLIPALSRLASEGERLVFVATAIESALRSRAIDVLAQRGLASRFRIERVSGERGVPAEPPPTPEAFDLGNETAVAFLLRARSLLEEGKKREAAETLRSALALDPELPAAHYELAKVQLQTDDMEGALASLRRTVELLPEYPSAWGNLGAALGEIRELDAAIEALQRAVELDPLSHALHSNLGVALREQGLLDEAEASFERTLALEPGFVFGHYNLGHVLYLKADYPKAIAAFEKAQSLDESRSPRQALLLAVTRLASGDSEGAHRDYREVFSRLEAPMRFDMRTVAEWDLKQLSQRTGVTPALREAATLLRSLA